MYDVGRAPALLVPQPPSHVHPPWPYLVSSPWQTTSPLIQATLEDSAEARLEYIQGKEETQAMAERQRDIGASRTTIGVRSY